MTRITGTEGGKFIYVLAGIRRAGNTEAKIEIECFQKLITKKVSLNHTKICNRSRSNFEFNSDKKTLN